MKRNIKLIIGILLGILLVSGISVYATYNYLAKDVSYTRNGIEMSVEQALNELYNNQKEKSQNFYVNDSFTIKTGTNYYNLEFIPSIVFIDCGGNIYTWTINGENIKYWSDNNKSTSGKTNDGTKIEGKGFYWTSAENNTVKLYAIK